MASALASSGPGRWTHLQQPANVPGKGDALRRGRNARNFGFARVSPRRTMSPFIKVKVPTIRDEHKEHSSKIESSSCK
jgi:hypothetical protein